MDLSGKTGILYLVCDTSGSMAEGGKCMLTRGIVRAIEQYVRLGCGTAEIKLVRWDTVAALVEWNPNDEFPEEFLQCGGSANAAALRELLRTESNGKILLLTDGWWSNDDAFALKKWKRTMPSDTLRILKIGADANPSLKGCDVFSAEEIFAALDGWLPLADAPESVGKVNEW